LEISGIFILLLIFIAVIALAIKNYPPDFVFAGMLTIIIIAGFVTPSQALVGFSNEGMLTVGALYIVATGLKETGGVQLIIQKLLNKPNGIRSIQARIITPIMGMSAFLNNTPIVASFIPALQEWSRKYRVPVSKLLIPLSYAAILGGTCTLIGTSTNLIVSGLLISEKDVYLNLFDPAYVGVPIALAGFVYLIIFGRKLLPDISSAYSSFENTREYTIEMILKPGSPMENTTVEQAGLRHLPGLFLVEIIRDGAIMAAAEPDETLLGGDRLIFTGLVDSIVDLQSMQSLKPATDQVFKLDTPRRDRHLIEAVVSQTNPLNGKSIKEGEFRNRFGAVVVAVSRKGERIEKKVGDIVLKTGDILLMEAPRDFTQRYKYSSDFLLVSTLSNRGTLNYQKGSWAWGILGVMVLLATFNVLSMFQASFLAAGVMVITGCVSVNDARSSIDWQVLIVIASALGIGNALQITGVAESLAGIFIGFAGDQPYLALISVYFITWMLTELITNNAAAVLIFPFALSVATNLEVSYMPYVMTIMFAASASFATPIGYQTNLMVYGAGGYRFSDFLKIGLPLNLIVAVITVLIVPIIWPF
jgi:di/tricarboxylate transporter